MRVAPVGLFAASLSVGRQVEETFRLATDIAALTHGHPTGSLTAGVFAVMIESLIGDPSMDGGEPVLGREAS